MPGTELHPVSAESAVTFSSEMYQNDFVVGWDLEDDYDYVDPLYAYCDAQFPDEYTLKINEARTGILVYEVPADFRKPQLLRQVQLPVEHRLLKFMGRIFLPVVVQTDFPNSLDLGILNPGCELESSRTAVSLAERFPYVYAAVGFHPSDCGEFSDASVEELRQLAAR